MRRQKTILLLLGLLALPACGDRAQLWDEAPRVLGPHAAAGHLWWLDGTRGLALVLDPRAEGAAVQRLEMRRNARAAALSASRTQLLVLSDGQEAVRKRQQEQEPGLSVLGLDGQGRARVERFYPLPGAFDRLATSADGKYAAAYHGDTAGAAGAGVFQNPNEVALLDLSLPAGGDNPRLHTLRSFGAAPLGVVFSPSMTVPQPQGTARTLAVVLATGQVSLLDMSHPGRDEITVPLALRDSSATVTPREVLFSTATATLFVRASGSSDPYALSLLARPAAESTDNDFTVHINQPSSGKTVLDMILFSDKGKDLLLTANASGDLSVIQAATSEHAVIALGEAVDTILAVPEDEPTVALIYSAAQPRARVHVLQLAGVQKALGANLVSRNLSQPVRQLVATPAGDQALAIHDDQRSVVSVLDLVSGHTTISPIQGELALTSYAFTAGGTLAGVSSGISELGLLDLATLQPQRLRLDHDPRTVLTLGEMIVVDHGAPQGLVTVVPTAAAGRDDCHVVYGFLLSGVLDHALED